MASDPDIIDKLLALLRRWGWETGYRRLQVELEQTRVAGDVREPAEITAFFMNWMAVERGDYATAEREAAAMLPALAGWARFVRAFAAFRRQEYAQAVALLNEAENSGDADGSFHAAIAHVRGATHYHRGDSAMALTLLKRARQLLLEEDPDHFGLGRVLDTIGMVYASTSNFHAAREFFLRAIEIKRHHQDIAGEALTNGQLGRLCLDWGLLRSARAYFERDRELSDRIEDERGKAQMANVLGQVALAEGKIDDATDWLDQSIRDSTGKPGWEVICGFAHKDRALACLADGDDATAAAHLMQAGTLFRNRSEPFAEGLAHVDRAWGIWHRGRQEWAEASDRLRAARRHFEHSREAVEIVRTRLEIARTERALGTAGAPLSLGLRHIVEAAEACRRVPLLREAEAAWREVDPTAYAEHLFQRARGRDDPEDVTDLMSGVTEGITALFLDIQNSTVFTRGHDPAEVMLTLNQLITDLAVVLRRYKGAVNCYRGDGFFALFRGENHARRAVEAALGMNEAVAHFNEPREILQLPLLSTRIGISTGPAFLGNMGTYDKVGFTAIGATVNLGARIEPHAIPGVPCVGEETWRAVRDHCSCRDPAGRTIAAKGFDPEQVRVWDVVGELNRAGNPGGSSS